MYKVSLDKEDSSLFKELDDYKFLVEQDTVFLISVVMT